MHMMSAFDLKGKKGLVLGLANDHSIAWGCARQAQAMGADIVASCLNDKARAFVEPLTQPLGMDLQTCNIETPEELEKLVAFARAMEVSCHSFATLAKLCSPHMTQGGSMITMSYLGADEAVPHYGLMGPVKAALESLVRYMALELGPQRIRVYAVSPGPILTRAASGIEAFDVLMQSNMTKAPLGRLVTLEEIANLSAFLCTDAASGMTGQTIYVDAGSHAVN
jgi:enoyl-[acyl-carrier protein] reductase I